MRLRAALLALLLLAASAPAPAAPEQPARRGEAEKRPAANAGARKEDARKEDSRKEEPKKDESRKDDARKGEAAPDEAVAPYEGPMLRLAETLGALTFLRDLCGAGDGPQWRERMQALLDAEGASEARRARLAGAFNRGFQGYAATYRVCTPNAELALSRRLAEGRKLSRDLAARWGG